MALRISDDPRRGAGHALLNLGLDPGQDMLHISVLNLLRSGGEYLGPSSVTKTNWVKQPYYFAARRAPEAGTAIFSIGPEVCNYLPPGTFVEIGSQDNLFAAEQVEWPGITARSDFAGALMGDLPNRTNPLPAFAPAPAVGIRSQKDPKQEIERIAETPKTLASAAHLEQSLPLPAAAPAAVPLPKPKGRRGLLALLVVLLLAAITGGVFLETHDGQLDWLKTFQITRQPSPPLPQPVAVDCNQKYSNRLKDISRLSDDDKVMLGEEALRDSCGIEAFRAFDAPDPQRSEAATWHLARFYDPNETAPVYRRAASVNPEYAAAYYRIWRDRSPRQAAALRQICQSSGDASASLRRSCGR